MKITRLTCFCAAAIALAAASGCASNRRVPAEPCRSYSMVAGAIGVNNATLVEEDVRPGRDGTVSVTETAFYQLRDNRSGRDVFQGVFSGGATVSAMDAAPGAMLRVAKERAMKMNIENFLLALDRAFPQEKKPAQP